MITGSNYSPSESVVCIGGTHQAKAAALYFEYILPLMYGECPESVLLPDCFESDELQHAITFIDLSVMQHLPGETRLGALPINQTSVNVHRDGKVIQYRPRHLELSEQQALEADLLIAKTYINEQSQFRRELSHCLSHRLKGMPLVASSAPLASEAATVDDISVIMTGMPLVDTDSVSWEQITEFREDASAKSKLRRFRLFAYDKLCGKSRAYVEDTLMSMMADHEAAAKDHGFDVITGSLITLANSKTLLATGAAAVAAAIAGTPVTAGIAALAGISLEIGKLAITVAQKQHAFHKLEQDHPLAYILDARKRLA